MWDAKQVLLAAGVCLGCVIASTGATVRANTHFAAVVWCVMGSVVFNMGKLLRKDV